MIEIQLNQREVPVGERVAGSVTWNGQAGATPRSIRVCLQWRTEGRGTVASDTLWEISSVPAESGQIYQVPFEFELPREGPISYDGSLLRLVWEITAHVDMRRGPDEHTVKAFRVVPRRL